MAGSAGREPILIASWNGGPATARAAELARGGTHLLDAIVAGIQLVEDDPEEMSVGYGGLPNEEGEVELDAAVMDAAAHRAGAVAGVRGYRHVARLALEVMRRTDHSLLVGDGAARFARQLGFPSEDLLTPKAREAWLLWKANLSDRDAWLPPGGGQTPVDFGKASWAGRDPRFGETSATADVRAGRPAPGASGGSPDAPFTFGTIHVSGLVPSGSGDPPAIACCTSTSGLSYKIPGRVGDSAVVGAGLYCDAGVGSAGATGRGESVLQACGSFSIVREMEGGATPTEACLRVLKQIADRTRAKRLLDAKGRPTFNVTLYALRADGLVGSASMHEGYTHVVQRGSTTSVEASAFLFAKGE